MADAGSTAGFRALEIEIDEHLEASRRHGRTSKVCAIALGVCAVIFAALVIHGLFPPPSLQADEASAIES